MHATININGELHDAASARVSVFDHGFLYGEGVYETLRTYSRRPFLFDRHVERLRRSAARIAVEPPADDDRLLAEVMRTVEAHGGTDEAYIRILLTRGVGPLTYRPEACPTPTLVILVKTFVPQAEAIHQEGVTIALVDIRRNHRDALDPHIKSNNLLNNALAMQQAYARGAEEALMCNLDGALVECAQSNIFLVRDGRLLTPPLEDGLLPGITRACVLELAASLGVPAAETSLRPDDLASADEAFLTGTTREVTAVVKVDDRPIGTGRPGPVTGRLLEAFRAFAARSVAG